MEKNVHPFEMSGMGFAPYKFVAIWTAPTIDESGNNIEAYNLDMKHRPECCNFACAHCGTAIMIHCIVENAQGKQYAVGSDCISKHDREGCADATLIAVRQRRRDLDREKREAKRQRDHEKYLNTVCNDLGETNRERQTREYAEEQQAQKDRENNVMNKWGFLIDALRNAGDFGRGMATSIENGREPYGRGVDIALEIYAKQFGRRGSKAFNEAFDSAEAKIN